MKLARITLVEMRRALHRRLVRWMVVVALGWCVVAAIAAFVTSADALKLARSDEHPARLVDWWVGGSGGGFLLVAAPFVVIGAAICGASVAGAEWRSGTITTVLTWEPRRVHLHAARTISSLLLAFAISLALQLVFLAGALPAIVAHGSTSGTSGEWWVSLLLAMLRISFVASLVAVLAVNVATIGRNTSAALVLLAAWALAVERLVAGLRPQLARFLISENVATVVPWWQIDGADFRRPPWLALVSLVAYVSVVVLAATVNFARRDVAAA